MVTAHRTRTHPVTTAPWEPLSEPASVQLFSAGSDSIPYATDCWAEHERYDNAARPGLTELTTMGGSLDSCRFSMGHTGFSEMRSMCGSMQLELERHASVACVGDDAANHAEAAHHCEVMRGWLTQLQTGADSMAGMGGMMGSRHACY